MRISDWSADVCSSDLTALVDLAKPSYRLGIARIKVGWEGHRLGVKVKTDKKSYTVRDTAEASIEVKTPDDKPAAGADVAFVAVDEALLQLDRKSTRLNSSH